MGNDLTRRRDSLRGVLSNIKQLLFGRKGYTVPGSYTHLKSRLWVKPIDFTSDLLSRLHALYTQ